MARVARESLFASSEVAIVHVVTRVVRRVFLMGDDRFSGKNYDYRKAWIEHRIKQLAAYFGIDVLCFSILSNHLHLVLRQRPDVVQLWSDDEIARRWLMLCPQRKKADGSSCEPTEPQLNSIRHDEAKLNEIRSRLSDISWWMRLMCQSIARRINHEDEAHGKVWEARFRAVRILDETSLLACAAYVDLNPIRAAMAQTLEQSDYTSIQRRIHALKQKGQAERSCGLPNEEVDGEITTDKPSGTSNEISLHDQKCSLAFPLPAHDLTRTTDSEDAVAESFQLPADRYLVPLTLDELGDGIQIQLCNSGHRCSDRGFLNMTTEQYIELLDWTARSIAKDKSGSTPIEAPLVWQRLNLGVRAETWCELVANFGRLFHLVAGKPQVVDLHRGSKRPKKFKLGRQARELLSA